MEVGRRGRSEIEEQNFLGIAVIVIISGLIGSIELRYGIGAVLLLGCCSNFRWSGCEKPSAWPLNPAGSAWVEEEEISTEELLARLTTFLDQR